MSDKEKTEHEVLNSLLEERAQLLSKQNGLKNELDIHKQNSEYWRTEAKKHREAATVASIALLALIAAAVVVGCVLGYSYYGPNTRAAHNAGYDDGWQRGFREGRKIPMEPIGEEVQGDPTVLKTTEPFKGIHTEKFDAPPEEDELLLEADKYENGTAHFRVPVFDSKESKRDFLEWQKANPDKYEAWRTAETDEEVVRRWKEIWAEIYGKPVNSLPPCQ